MILWINLKDSDFIGINRWATYSLSIAVETTIFTLKMPDQLAHYERPFLACASWSGRILSRH